MMKNLNMPESQEYRSILSANTANMTMFGESSIMPASEPVGSVDAAMRFFISHNGWSHQCFCERCVPVRRLLEVQATNSMVE